ncbi:extracellular solute-binding protein [Streptomyces longwoodensis]|uniref:extracellular solute-binding protein n=1 Tax=Streptomyces longwoodensis TaxID=68231 RepID=UPI003AF247DC
MQAEYQALPTLVSNDALADISRDVGDAKGKFAEGVWQPSDARHRRDLRGPQDIGPMMFYYRADLFEKYGLTVPTTWDEFAATARKLKEARTST